MPVQEWFSVSHTFPVLNPLLLLGYKVQNLPSLCQKNKLVGGKTGLHGLFIHHKPSFLPQVYRVYSVIIVKWHWKLDFLLHTVYGCSLPLLLHSLPALHCWHRFISYEFRLIQKGDWEKDAIHATEEAELQPVYVYTHTHTPFPLPD